MRNNRLHVNQAARDPLHRLPVAGQAWLILRAEASVRGRPLPKPGIVIERHRPGFLRQTKQHDEALVPHQPERVAERFGASDGLDHQIGIGEIGMIVGYTQERIESVTDAIGDGSKWGVNITYIGQDAPRGIAHAILCAKDFVGENPFIVYLGDNILKDGIARFVKKFSSEQVDAGLLLAEVDDPLLPCHDGNAGYSLLILC